MTKREQQLREYVKEQEETIFHKWANKAKKVTFFGCRTESLDKLRLMAAIGYLLEVIEAGGGDVGPR